MRERQLRCEYAHLDAEVTSALGRMNRSGLIPDDAVRAMLGSVLDAPVVRHPLPDFASGRGRSEEISGARMPSTWSSRNHSTSKLVTTDQRLELSCVADVISV